MENKGTINEIKSKYILKNIFNYIQNKNFEPKLFFYSKYFRKKLNINYSLCYQKYLYSMRFYINDYLYIDQCFYEKDILKNEYDNFISNNKLNKEKFEKIIYEIINNQNEININKNQYINIDSPLFEIISKTKDFDKNYTIYISQKNIDEYKLKEDYIIQI